MIPVSKPDINKSDINFVSGVLKSSFVAGGQELGKFEKEIAAFCNRRFAVAVSNGTSALFLALQSLNLPVGSKVLLPQFTIISALYAVKGNNLAPFFVEVDPRTWNVSLQSVKKALAAKIAAAVIVETYASAPPVKQIVEALKSKGVKIIEDAAEGFGGKEDNRPFGSYGDLSILSFYGNKLITTGEGGMVLTDSRVLYERLCSLRNLSFDSERKFIHKNLSGNFRLTNLQAALGLSQFKRINSLYKHRQTLYNLYLKLLRGLEDYMYFQSIPENVKSSYWVFPILLKSKVKENASGFMQKLKKRGIESRHFFYPLGLQPCLGKNEMADSEISLKLWQRGIYLPLGNGIAPKEIEITCKEISRLLK